MNYPKLGPDFFAKNTPLVAKNLLGKYLCRRLPDGQVISARIIETEAYRGFNDQASHAHKGRTKRTEVMFSPPGTIYVYLIYGMYHCLNLVTEKKDYPAAVLIRAVEGVNGPGKVCKYLQVDRKLNNQMLGKELWVEDHGIKVSSSKIQVLRRVGVDYAGESKNWPWRFLTADPRKSKRG
ncbi:MAG: DNA-3-methyladenine glycosylase [Parcubacteria group bacterium]|nr:DNA-3-methyladenine glycosylase [Parcubacteria group bacterium]